MSTNDFTNEYKKKIDSMQILYRFKGSVNTLQELQNKENNVLGDVWNCKENNKNYCWNNEEWVDIGLVIDISGLATEQDINSIKVHKYTKVIETDTEKGAEVTLPCSYKVR